MERPLFTFLYHYGLGGLLFAVGLWGAWRAGALDFRASDDRRWFWALLLGLFVYMAGHAFFQFLV